MTISKTEWKVFKSLAKKMTLDEIEDAIWMLEKESGKYDENEAGYG